MAILAMMGHGQDARGTSRVGTSGAGPRPNAVRPYIARNILAKKTRIYGIAMQGPIAFRVTTFIGRHVLPRHGFAA